MFSTVARTRTLVVMTCTVVTCTVLAYLAGVLIAFAFGPSQAEAVPTKCEYDICVPVPLPGDHSFCLASDPEYPVAKDCDAWVVENEDGDKQYGCEETDCM